MSVQAIAESRVSTISRPVVLPCVEPAWVRHGDRMAPAPPKGAWFAWNAQETPTMSVVIPVIGCPSCGSIFTLAHSQGAARVLTRMLGRPVPVGYKIDKYGKVEPDLHCAGKRCSFKRAVYLDRWDKTKPLYAIAYTADGSLEVQFTYCHATNQQEALAHLGLNRRCKVIDVAPAVGFFYDEKRNRLTTG